MKICFRCKTEKEDCNFRITGRKKNRLHSYCNDCNNEYHRELYNKDTKYFDKRKERVAKYKAADYKGYVKKAGSNTERFYKSTRGRALTLLKSAARRCDKYKETMDLDFEFIHEKILTGYCEVTGIKFDLEKPKNTSKNPYSPSIDRIDPKIGYTRENTRIVIWQYNLMKGELSDVETFNICKLIIERKNNDN